MHPLFHPLFVDYCTFFNGNQDYFECHEVLEEYWKIVAPGVKDHPLVGYIQLATGMYHWRRNNFTGAQRMLKKANVIFTSNYESPFFELLDLNQLCINCLESLVAINEKKQFKAFPLIMTDHLLEATVRNHINELPLLPYDFLLNKHMLRDRTDILKMREEKRKGRR